MLSWVLAISLVILGLLVVIPFRALGITVRSWRWREGRARLIDIDIDANDAIYEYEVADRSLTGTRLNVLGYAPANARRRLESYKIGAEVPVWFDPDAPQDAVLDRSSTLIAWLATALGAIALLGGIVWLTKLSLALSR